MKRLILFSFLLFSTVLLYAQNVAINNDGSQPHASAALDIKATDKGLLLPRVANPAGAVSNAAEGLLLYNTTTQQPNFYNGTNWQGMGGTLSTRFPRAILRGQFLQTSPRCGWKCGQPAMLAKYYLVLLHQICLTQQVGMPGIMPRCCWMLPPGRSFHLMLEMVVIRIVSRAVIPVW